LALWEDDEFYMTNDNRWIRMRVMESTMTNYKWFVVWMYNEVSITVMWK
jgi:hypothetical protein